MLKSTAALFGALCVLIAPGAALAQTVTYNISGTFTAPATGSFSGSYVVNTVPNTIVSANIQVTAGKANDGTTSLPANTYIFAGAEIPSLFTIATGVPAGGLRGAWVSVAGTKAAPTAVSNFQEGVCNNPDCSGITVAPTVGRNGSGTVALAPAGIPGSSRVSDCFGRRVPAGALISPRPTRSLS